MREPVESRAARLLREAPDQALPLGALYERLRADGYTTASRDSLLAAIRRRDDLFTTVAPPPPFGDEPAWDELERLEYRGALEALGAAGEPRVALRSAPSVTLDLQKPARAGGAGRDAVFATTEQLLLAIWRDTQDDRLRADVGSAFAELDRMRARLGAARLPAGPR